MLAPAGEDGAVPASGSSGEGSPATAGSPRGGEKIIRIEPGTPMEKQIPYSLVDPYLTGQRSILAGFAYRAADAVFAGPRWPAETYRDPGAADSPEHWVLRWRALEFEAFLAAGQPGPAQATCELYLVPGPLPVGTEMFRVTPAREELVARYDGQDWLHSAPGG